MKWQDITSYSQNDTERKPRVLECIVGNIKFKVHKYVELGDFWFLTSSDIGVYMYELNTTDLEEAKAKAIKTVILMLDKRKAEIDNALEDIYANSDFTLGCNGCDYHYDYYDSDGNHDGCSCSNPNAVIIPSSNPANGITYHDKCCGFDVVCPYRED